MKKPYRIFIPKDQTYEYEIWLVKNNFRSAQVKYLSKFSVVIFHDEQEAVLFKLQGRPNLVSSTDSPDIGIINKIRKTLDLYSTADVLDLTVTFSK